MGSGNRLSLKCWIAALCSSSIYLVAIRRQYVSAITSDISFSNPYIFSPHTASDSDTDMELATLYVKIDLPLS